MLDHGLLVCCSFCDSRFDMPHHAIDHARWKCGIYYCIYIYNIIYNITYYIIYVYNIIYTPQNYLISGFASRDKPSCRCWDGHGSHDQAQLAPRGRSTRWFLKWCGSPVNICQYEWGKLSGIRFSLSVSLKKRPSCVAYPPRPLKIDLFSHGLARKTVSVFPGYMVCSCKLSHELSCCSYCSLFVPLESMIS